MNQLEYCQKQLSTLAEQITAIAPFNSAESLSETETLYMETLTKLCANDGGEDHFEQGQWLISQTVANYPHITPLVPRDLFWYFGGDCLHFMPDEEISKFQQLDEICHESDQQAINYQEERSKIFGLH